MPPAYRAIAPKAFWYQAASVYAALALGALISPLTQPNMAVADLRGTTWMTGDIYQSMALVTVFTMVFFAVLSLIRTARDASIPHSEQRCHGSHATTMACTPPPP